MAEERIYVENKKCTIDKKSGHYTGDAIKNIRGIIPDGNGTFVMEDRYKMSGIFKEGNFISGNAIATINPSSNPQEIYLSGGFYNFSWLSGTIKYPNGDYIEGERDPRNNDLVMKKFRFTQSFGDIVEGSNFHKRDKKIFYNCDLTMIDGNTITGEFEAITSGLLPRQSFLNDFKFLQDNQDYSVFELTRPALIPSTATLSILLYSDKKNPKNNITFEGKCNPANSADIVIGEYHYNMDNGKKSKHLLGAFNLKREKAPGYNHLPEDYENFNKDKLPNIEPLKYDLHFISGEMKITSSQNSEFLGEKAHFKEGPQYTGKLTNPDGSFEGNFELIENRLVPSKCKVNIKNYSINRLYNSFITATEGTFNRVANTFDGTVHYENKDFEKGLFKLNKATILPKHVDLGIPSAFAFEPTLVNGTLRLHLEPNKVFSGSTNQIASTYSNDNELSIQYETTDKTLTYPTYQDFRKTNKLSTIAFVGKTEIMDDKLSTIYTESGLFDKNFELVFGNIKGQREIRTANCDINGRYINGLSEGADGFYGVVLLLNGEEKPDKFVGKFDKDFCQQYGELIFTTSENAVVEGYTPDMWHFEGVYIVGNTYREGEFTLHSIEKPTLNRGMIVTKFPQRKGNVICMTDYDEKGLGDKFEGHKYFSKITQDNHATRYYATDSVKSAMQKYDMDDKVATIIENYIASRKVTNEHKSINNTTQQDSQTK